MCVICGSLAPLLTPSPAVIALLAAVALVAGLVDAIAGGGGLLTVPVLLAVGLPTDVALGTNKAQAVFGAGSAVAGYAHAGQLSSARAWLTFPAAFLGSLAGVALVLLVDPKALRPLVIVLLVVAAAIVALRRPGAPKTNKPPIEGRAATLLALGIALAIGAYDGFFGPGTGTFAMLAFVMLCREPVTRATGDAKVLNFGSNLAAVISFALHGRVVVAIALPMAVAQLVGGFVGARIAVRGGERLIRATVLLVVLGLVAKVAWDLWRAHEGR